MLINIFQPRFDSDRDRLNIVSFLLGYIRTGNANRNAAPPLKSGRWRWDREREEIGQSLWKWSEAQGKYLGCPFWSIAAATAVERVARENQSLSEGEIENLASCKAKMGQRQIQHEHVFPRKDLRDMLRQYVGRHGAFDEQALRRLLDAYCVACIVTAEEHHRLPREGNSHNPWLRYMRTSVPIKLLDNPGWSSQHRLWIQEAGIHVCPSLDGAALTPNGKEDSQE